MRIALLLILLLPLAGAQDAVYFTNEEVTGGTANIVYAASQDVPADGKAYGAFAQLGLSYSSTFQGTLSGDYEPGAWDLRILLSCDIPTLYRPTTTADAYRPTMTATLSIGGATLPAVHGESTLRTCDGPEDVWSLTWAIDGSETAPVAGSSFSVLVSVWWLNPPPGATENGFFVIGGAGSGLFGLTPAATEAPAEEIAAGDINLTENFTGAWAGSVNGTGNLTLNAQVNATQQFAFDFNGTGNHTISVWDGNGTQMYEGTSNGTAVLNGTAGNWTIKLAFVDALGALNITMHDWVAAETAGNQTAQADPAPKEGAPGLPLVVLISSLALLALRRK